MNAYIIFWSIVIFFSLVSFSIMSFKMLIKGVPELKEMFRQLNDTSANRKKENGH
jgi:hypothetical protein